MDMKQLLQRLRAAVLTEKESIVDSLMHLVEIPSVAEDGAGDCPLGEGVQRALAEATDLAKGLGATRVAHCGRYAYADFGKIEDGAAYIGIFTHLDVVPAGEGWLKSAPFTPTIDGGALYGRGTEDDKAGAVEALYALSAIRAAGLTLAHPVRVFFGGDEERGMSDMEAFLADIATLPALSLVPDASYPVSLGEKGICHLEIEAPPLRTVRDMRGGMATNIVTAECEVRLSYDEPLLSEIEDKVRGREGYHLSYEDDEICLKTVGIPAHASTPDGSKNATLMAASLLAACQTLHSADRAAFRAIERLLADNYGTALGLAHEDTRFGRLTATGGTVAFRDGRACLSLDVRYGTELAPECLEERVKSAVHELGGLFGIRVIENRAGFHIPEDSAASTLLLTVYREASGDALATPYYMGGGTYARELPNAYSIGTAAGYVGTRPCLPEGHGMIHGKDEYILIDALTESTALLAAMTVLCDRSL